MFGKYCFPHHSSALARRSRNTAFPVQSPRPVTSSQPAHFFNNHFCFSKRHCSFIVCLPTPLQRLLLAPERSYIDFYFALGWGAVTTVAFVCQRNISGPRTVSIVGIASFCSHFFSSRVTSGSLNPKGYLLAFSFQCTRVLCGLLAFSTIGFREAPALNTVLVLKICFINHGGPNECE